MRRLRFTNIQALPSPSKNKLAGSGTTALGRAPPVANNGVPKETLRSDELIQQGVIGGIDHSVQSWHRL